MRDYSNYFSELLDELRDRHEAVLDRFYDERDEDCGFGEPAVPETCGECEYFAPCDIEGHTDIGWCRNFSWFYKSTDPWDECWEVD